MGESREYVTQTHNDGTVHISNEVISSIAALAANEVEGVCGLAAGMGTEFAELLGKKSLSKGVKLSVAEDALQIECNVVLYYGSSIQAICSRIQSEVTTAVESMTGLSVSKVNVNVCGISLANQEPTT